MADSDQLFGNLPPRFAGRVAATPQPGQAITPRVRSLRPQPSLSPGPAPSFADQLAQWLWSKRPAMSGANETGYMNALQGGANAYNDWTPTGAFEGGVRQGAQGNPAGYLTGMLAAAPILPGAGAAENVARGAGRAIARRVEAGPVPDLIAKAREFENMGLSPHEMDSQLVSTGYDQGAVAKLREFNNIGLSAREIPGQLVSAGYDLAPVTHAEPAAQAPGATAGGAGKLFDYSDLGKVPAVPQFNLPRYAPPRGVPPRIGGLTANPDVRQGMLDTIQRGVDMGGADWYNAEPLRQHFVSELGDAEGNQRFQQYMDMVAATSPRSDVGTNVRNASYYYNRLVNDQGMPAVGDINPQPYGHMAQRLHQMNAERVASGGWDPLNNPKPASFAQNLTGNQQPVAVDTHAFRLPGMLAQDPRFLETAYQSSKDAPKQNIQQLVMSGQMSMEDALKQPVYWQAQPKANEYGAMEQYYQGLARDQGLSPAQAQAAAWVGGGQTTGLASDASKPFIGFVEDRANKTADVRGLSPAEALSQFIRGKAPLLGVGAAGAATWPLWQQFQQYQQPQGGDYGQPAG